MSVAIRRAPEKAFSRTSARRPAPRRGSSRRAARAPMPMPIAKDPNENASSLRMAIMKSSLRKVTATCGFRRAAYIGTPRKTRRARERRAGRGGGGRGGGGPDEEGGHERAAFRELPARHRARRAGAALDAERPAQSGRDARVAPARR